MKKALVTGVSWDTGIGYAISKQLIEDGYFVYAIYHSKDSTAKENWKKITRIMLNVFSVILRIEKR